MSVVTFPEPWSQQMLDFQLRPSQVNEEVIYCDHFDSEKLNAYQTMQKQAQLVADIYAKSAECLDKFDQARFLGSLKSNFSLDQPDINYDKIERLVRKGGVWFTKPIEISEQVQISIPEQNQCDYLRVGERSLEMNARMHYLGCKNAEEFEEIYPKFLELKDYLRDMCEDHNFLPVMPREKSDGCLVRAFSWLLDLPNEEQVFEKRHREMDPPPRQ